MTGDESRSRGGADPEADRLQRAREIFFAVRELTLAAREEAIDAACPDDRELREIVLLLLRGERAPMPIEGLADELRAAAGHLAPTGVGGVHTVASPPDQRGGRIGRYRLLDRIGEGGFGVVFAAEQTEPVKRRVALKVIKLGMDTRQVVARFEAERQALAMMDHPNIAKVFDAGATETGRPYFVMELVKGLPITEYCDQRKLSIPARLELFSLVCDALQHAHQKGVIHRDIKPSNVLVSEMGEKVVPKVIDFGIAKATNAELTDKTIFTEMRQMIGTPEYMSPEQAGVSGLDVDTRTDVYSLGVLLYELLAGTTPFDSKRLRSAAYGEVQRIIREEDPPRPSTKLTTLETIATVAQVRGIEAARLSSALKGELDWVVMKCLEKDRGRRYDSAGALMRDVRRFISGEAVQAVPPSAAYRFKKIVRRNQGPVVAGSLLAFALFAGLVGTSLGFFNAEAQRKVAEKETIRAGQEKDRADENAAQARAAEDFATRQAYSANLMSASAAVHGVQYSTARTFLDAAPNHLRAWEWRVLDAKLDSSIRTCSIAAKPRSGVECNLILHPDGRSFFTIDSLGDTVAQRWDLASGHLLQSFPVPDPAKELRHFQAFLSPDGRRLTTLPRYRAPGSKSFMVDTWDLSTGERTAHEEVACPTGSEVHTIVSQDGSRVFVYESERVWSTRIAPGGTNKGAAAPAPSAILAERPLTQRTYPQAINHADTVIAESVDSSPYGLVLSDAASLAPITVIAWRTLVQNVCFSNDDRWLGVTGNDDIARVYDLDANPPTYVALKHPYQANNIRFYPDGSLVATIAMDRAIRIWDRATGRLLSTYPSETLDPWPLMFMPDGKTVAGWESEGTIRFWDVTAENATVLRSHKSIVSSAKFAAGNPAGIIVSSSWEGADGSTGIVRFWDADSGDEVGTYHGQLGDIVFGMDVSDDGRFAAIAISNQHTRLRSIAGTTDEPTGRTEIIDLTTGQRVATTPSRRTPWRIAFGGDHQSVVMVDFHNGSGVSFQLHLLDTRSGAVMRTRELDPKPEWVFARSPDGKTLAALPASRSTVASKADRPGTMLILDTQTLETVREIDGMPEGQASLAFSPDGSRVATGGEDGLLRIFKADTGEQVAAMSGQGMKMMTIAFSPDGARIASAGVDRKVGIWDANTFEQVGSFAGHEGHIGCLDWDATGHRLVSCSGDFTIRILEPDPIRTRVQAREARKQALTQVEPMVSKLLGELGDAASVAERIKADTSLSPLLRKTALQFVLRTGLEAGAARR